ncbi:toxin-antitoxin system YwqK family antitoxin [Hymenobacter jejuensis]|nr:hypothetical protein [Hymenobacter jejuensis]
MGPKTILLTVMLGMLTACSATHGKIGSWSRNRHDRAGERHGPWYSYYDTNNQLLTSKGRFKHGRMVGRWRYFTPGAGLEQVERFHKLRPGFVTITYYHPNGQIARRGRARYVNESDGLRFYWFGNWMVYAADGKAAKVETYEVGRLLYSRPLQLNLLFE